METGPQPLRICPTSAQDIALETMWALGSGSGLLINMGISWEYMGIYCRKVYHRNGFVTHKQQQCEYM